MGFKSPKKAHNSSNKNVDKKKANNNKTIEIVEEKKSNSSSMQKQIEKYLFENQIELSRSFRDSLGESVIFHCK